MKTFLRISTMLLTWAIALVLTSGTAAVAQVSNYPYAYGFGTGGQDPITGDSNWGSQTSNGNGPNDWIQSSAGGSPFGSGGGSAYLLNFVATNKFSRLVVSLNTSGKTFDGSSEFAEFWIRRDGTGDHGQLGNDATTVTVEYSTDGINYTVIDGPSTLTSYADTTYSPKLLALPSGMGDQSSVFFAITVTTSNGGQNRFDNIYVDDFSLAGGALPIQLASSAANVIRSNDVEVAWKTVSETNNFGFEISRRRGETGDWTKLGFVQGHGTTLAPQSYSYIDRSLSFGKYSYRIKQIDLDGQSKDYPAMEVTVGASDKFVLAQNYPNPFNPSTMVEFAVPQSGFATMKVYNALGQEVATLFEGNADAGKVYTARFNASSLPSGLYFYTLKSAGKSDTKRMLLLK